MASKKPLQITASQRLELLRKTSENLRNAEKPVADDTVYIVFAHNRSHFRIWARQYGIGVAKMIYADSNQRLEGHHDFCIISMARPSDDLDPRLVARVMKEAKTIYDTHLFYPVTEGGIIKHWKAFVKP